jgi:hypothetical protein
METFRTVHSSLVWPPVCSNTLRFCSDSLCLLTSEISTVLEVRKGSEFLEKVYMAGTIYVIFINNGYKTNRRSIINNTGTCILTACTRLTEVKAVPLQQCRRQGGRI